MISGVLQGELIMTDLISAYQLKIESAWNRDPDHYKVEVDTKPLA